jgi:hypothetical protein
MNEMGSGVTNPSGVVTDKYALFFYGGSGSYSFDQTIIVGNWETLVKNRLFATGAWQGGQSFEFK